MPKSARKSTSSSNGVSKSDPYAGSAARKKAHGQNNIFKFNTSDFGQHILKNPGVAQAIVDKADLKQSDVCRNALDPTHPPTNPPRSRSYSKSVPEPET